MPVKQQCEFFPARHSDLPEIHCLWSLTHAGWTLSTAFAKTFIFGFCPVPVPCFYPDSGTVLLLVHGSPAQDAHNALGKDASLRGGGMPGLGTGQDPSGRVTLWPVVACTVA